MEMAVGSAVITVTVPDALKSVISTNIISVYVVSGLLALYLLLHTSNTFLGMTDKCEIITFVQQLGKGMFLPGIKEQFSHIVCLL